jgi:hypothetical protein
MMQQQELVLVVHTCNFMKQKQKAHRVPIQPGIDSKTLLQKKLQREK